MVARKMSFCKSIVFLTLGLINCSNCHVKWRLEQTYGNQKIQTVGDRLWRTKSTFGRVFCAVLCFQSNGCSFFEHHNNTCLGYKRQEPRDKKLNILTCNQGNFKRYIESGAIAKGLLMNSRHVLFKISDSRIKHISSLAASRVHEHILYTINDGTSGPRENKIYAIDLKRGEAGRNPINFEITLSEAVNGDWEAVAVGPCNKESCIYIGDIGKSPATGRVENRIYRLKEPEAKDFLTFRSATGPRGMDVQYKNQQRIRWPGRTDKEGACLMIDPTGDVYIISTAEDNQSRMAKIPASRWGKKRARLKPIARLSTSLTEGSPVACDLSTDGKKMLIKFNSGIYYWSVPDGDYGKAIKEPGRRLPFNHQANVKAVAWSHKGDGYYTLPEGTDQNLSLYVKM